jgi:hypothetical protein
MTTWTDLVTKTYKTNHAKNAKYMFKDAMRDAKKVYKKSSTEKSKPGNKSKKASRKSRKIQECKIECK